MTIYSLVCFSDRVCRLVRRARRHRVQRHDVGGRPPAVGRAHRCALGHVATPLATGAQTGMRVWGGGLSVCLCVSMMVCQCGGGWSLSVICVELCQSFSAAIRPTKFPAFSHHVTSPFVFCGMSSLSLSLSGPPPRAARQSAARAAARPAIDQLCALPARAQGARHTRVAPPILGYSVGSDAVNHCSDNSHSFEAFHEICTAQISSKYRVEYLAIFFLYFKNKVKQTYSNPIICTLLYLITPNHRRRAASSRRRGPLALFAILL
jgi:hypothetical protein